MSRSTAEANRDLALDVVRTFSTEQGQRVLEWLKEACGESRPAFLGETWCPLKAAYADGRRSVLLEIQAKCKHASSLHNQ